MLSCATVQLPPEQIVGWRVDQPVRRESFVSRASTWYAHLQQTGGNRFALYMSDSLEFAAALFGAWHAGKTIYLPADALPATCDALRGTVDGFIGEFDAVSSPLVLLPDDVANDTTVLSTPLSPDLPGLVVYTSGSTGAPQAIPKRLSQLAAEVETLESLFGERLGSADIVATVSHQHIYGLLFKVLWPLTAARAIHARSLIYPEELAQAVSMRNCMLVSSPAHLKRLPDSSAWTSAQHRVRAVFSSGGPLMFETAQATERVLGMAPIEVYGSSETGGIAWRQRHAASDEVWTTLPGVRIRIAAEGELEVCSDHLPDQEWFRLADRAQLTESGFLLKGRADRIVKIEEKRISLDAIEAALAASPLVTQARVLVLDGRRQRVAAFVVLTQTGQDILRTAGKPELNRQLRAALASSIEAVALPRVWRYLDAMPVNAQGKTTQADLFALLDGEEDRRPLRPQMRLLERDTVRAVYEVIAQPDLLYFDGHFPEAPILAGVVQVDWAIAFGRECFDLPPWFKGIHALKFQRVIRPGMPVTLELTHEPAKSALVFRYSSLEGQHASGRILFGAEYV